MKKYELISCESDEDQAFLLESKSEGHRLVFVLKAGKRGERPRCILNSVAHN
jgi:hypothetical protein